jgi:dihydroorotate dehydrogenase
MNKVRAYELVWPLIAALTRPNPVHDRAVAVGEALQRHPALLRVVEWAVVQGGRRPACDRLRVDLGGLPLDNPLILAAGFDKDGRCPDTLHRIGFGAVVVGTVTRTAQPGNPLPTLFRPARGVILNRMGFPGQGMDAVQANLAGRRERAAPLGVSVGLNKTAPHSQAPADYAAVVRTLYDEAAFFEVNVSSPNTPGLRALQDRDRLIAIVEAVQEQMQQSGGPKPLFVKIAPDLTPSAVDEVIGLALDRGVTGVVATNTTQDPAIRAALGARWAAEAGGVSGAPLAKLSSALVAYIYRQAGGRLVIVGSGGVSTLEGLLEKVRAGASAVQLYTGLIYRGPGLPSRLAWELDRWMQAEGAATVAELVGIRSHEKFHPAFS